MVTTESLLRDSRFSLRNALRKPGHTVLLILVLSLGVGGVTAIFAVLHGVILRPFPFIDPEQTVILQAPHPPETSPMEWWGQSASLEFLAQYEAASANLGEGDSREIVPVAVVSSQFFRVFGVRPQLGRAFASEEDLSRGRVGVLSYGLWVRAFGGRTDIVGHRVRLNEESFEIIGILEPGFGFPGRTDVWIPRADDDDSISQLLGPSLPGAVPPTLRSSLVGRLTPGTKLAEARSELWSRFELLKRTYSNSGINFGNQVSIHRLQYLLVQNYQQSLFLLFLAALVVLVLACANTAALMLAKMEGRRNEIAIRMSLGAGRGRIVRQVLSEGLLVVLLSAPLSFLLAYGGLRMIQWAGPAEMPRLAEISIDGITLIFAFLTLLLTGIVVSGYPAWVTANREVMKALKDEENRFLPGRWRGWFFLVVGEIALAQVLLVGAGLILMSYNRLESVSPGFDPEGVATLRVSLPAARYDSNSAVEAAHRQILEKVGGLPGMVAVGGISKLPLSGSSAGYQSVEVANQYVLAQTFYATGEYFHALGIPLYRGRSIGEDDNYNAPRVVVINQALANRYWLDSVPVGKALRIEGEDFSRRIVGVVGDVKTQFRGEDNVPQMYLPYLQPFRDGKVWRDLVLVARTDLDASGLFESVREAIATVEGAAVVYGTRTLDSVLVGSTAPQRFRSLLLEIFAFVAIVLAMAGLYGVISFRVNRRVHEIGIRIALGARPVDVIRLVLREGMALAFTGVVLGSLGAFWLTRFLEGLLYGVERTDVAIYTTVALLLTAVALLACYLPARRATQVDPMTALRYE